MSRCPHPLVRRQIAGPGAILIAASALGLAGARADLVELRPAGDTTLIELAPDNNLGGQLFCNAGSAGPGNTARNRALYRFDVAAAIPAGCQITSAMLILEITGEPEMGGVSAVFRLHRMLRPWGEGTKKPPSSPGLGLPATTGEATWKDRFALTTNAWAIPGGEANTDFTLTPSAEQQVYGVGESPYTFGPAAVLTADLQTWLDEPGLNHGWILICSVENIPKTARRFGSREDPINAPRLLVDYLPPLQVDGVSLDSGLQLEFTALAGRAYRVEFLPALENRETWKWSTLQAVPPPVSTTTVVVTDAVTTAPRRFYRVVQLP